MPSILQAWVTELGLRYQGVLLGAVRGCDGVPKEDPSKYVVRGIRQLCLVPFDAREIKLIPNGYMSVTPDKLVDGVVRMLDNLDHYPVHFLSHLMQAAEVIGRMHPDGDVTLTWLSIYQDFCDALHLRPERRRDLKRRMTEIRV
jgi:hypothetical protein